MPAAAYSGEFHIDHVLSAQHGGQTVLENLALACGRCNRRKGPNIAGLDPESGELVKLFNPRKDRWTEHFAWDGPDLNGLTAVGRVTVDVLGIGDPVRRDVREILQREGTFDWG